MPPSAIEEIFRTTYSRLINITRKFLSLAWMRIFLFAVFYLLVAFVAFVFLELLIDLAPMLRFGFWVTVILIGLFYIVRHLLPLSRQIFRPHSEELYKISKLIGDKNSDVNDSLIDFLQIYNDRSMVSHPAFKNLSLRQLYQKFRNAEFRSIMDFKILREPAKRILILGSIFVLLFLIFPQSMNEAVLKVLYPAKSFEGPAPIALLNNTGDKMVLKNEEVTLEGSYQGIRPQKLWLIVETVDLVGDSSVEEKLEIPAYSGKNFSYQINHTKSSFSYWFEADIGIMPFKNGSVVSGKGRIIVRDRPYLRNLQVKLEYPPYTRLEDKLLAPNDGEINALLGTSINLEIEANKVLRRAEVVFKDSSTSLMRTIENRGYGKFNVSRDDEYKITILDEDSISNYQPVEYSIFALRDEYPFVEITKPGQDLDIDDNLNLPLLLNLRDDFGFTKLSLRGRVVRGGLAQDTNLFDIDLPYQYAENGKAIHESVWDLHSFYLIPDDYIQYFAEVWDNDRISGPKSYQSGTYILRLPSIMDMMEGSGEKLSEQLEKTDEIVKESGELRKKLEVINRDMKRENELTWERKKELKEQLEIQKGALNKLENIQKGLEEVVNELDNKNILSPETLEKYFELQKMFQDLATPEMLEAMHKLQEAIEKADVNEIKKALEDFNLSVEEFEKSVERTYELFKQIQLEQKMDEINKLAEKITEDQKQINESLEENDKIDKDQLGNKESNLGRETDFLKEEIGKTLEDFEELVSNQLQDLQNAQQFLEEGQIPDQMRQMQQELSGGQMQEARMSGQIIQQQMEMLQNMLKQAQQNMAQMQKQEVMQAMQKVTQDLLKASFQQENLFEQSNKTDIASPQVNDIASKQAQMRENANRIIKQLIDISKKTFFLSPQMNQNMSSLINNIDAALNNLENRNTRNAAKAQKDAMGDLNRAVLSMESSMDQLSQSSSASGFESFMQQLQQMSGQQGQLNQQGMSLLEQSGKGQMQLSKDALARLAAQQEMIRESLEHLSEEMGHRGDVLGRLDGLSKEMEEVVKKLQQQQLDRKVIQRQEQILSRLLDAQKSIREKEFSKKRQAERGDKMVVKSPPELRRQILDKENILHKELIQALNEGYSTEYKDYIKLYYEILSRRSLEDSNF